MEKSDSFTDSVLFARLSTGDEDAFRQIFHAFNSRLSYAIFRLVKSETETEEIIQEVFLRLWVNREKLPGIENPGGWLHTIASNLALSSLRRQATRRKNMQAISASADIHTDEPAMQLDAKEIQHIVQEAIAQLPASRRQVFILSRQQGLNRREIAKQLNISESTVKNQLGAALKFIQDYLQKNMGLYLPLTLIALFCQK
ncbi:MAG TPA: RNA polymerase sigma-70 factor [Chitinophagaceae bacterium]|nr:RNA polymerase sigma-70 factor [Chitinophagaceae bacterium]